MIPQVTDRTAEELICEEPRVIMMWFFSYESIPCDHARPEVERFDKEFCEIAKCVGLNVDENPHFTEDMLIEAVPTILMIKDADEIARWEGPYSFEALGERFKKILKRQA